MNAIDVIKTELACVQRDCCRVENQCAKCDLVLPVEEIISAYKKCISLLEHEAQIEKMKCCGNCKYSNQESVYSIVCKVGGVDKSDYINIDDNQVCDKWEIKENDRRRLL